MSGFEGATPRRSPLKKLAKSLQGGASAADSLATTAVDRHFSTETRGHLHCVARCDGLPGHSGFVGAEPGLLGLMDGGSAEASGGSSTLIRVDVSLIPSSCPPITSFPPPPKEKGQDNLALQSGRRDLNPRRPPWQGGLRGRDFNSLADLETPKDLRVTSKDLGRSLIPPSCSRAITSFDGARCAHSAAGDRTGGCW